MPPLLEDGQRYACHLGDCIPQLHRMPSACADFSIFSPPFPSVYAYTDSEADMGNSEDLRGEAKLHFSFFCRAIRRVIKPGRVMLVHCTDIVRMKRSGGQGMFDFAGLLIRLAERAGFIFDYRWCVRKNPQSQAIRTKSRELQFSGLESDRARSRGANPDWLLKFRAPGENAVPVNSKGDVSRNDWIQWAEPSWDDIRETDTLNVAEGRSENDTKHICPLQLKLIDRSIRLYSNPGELVFTPFAGLGSEMYEAIRLGRNAYGCELKPEYHAACLKNCERALVKEREDRKTLFDDVAVKRPRQRGTAVVA